MLESKINGILQGRARNCDSLVGNEHWRLMFCPMTKENQDTTIVFKTLH